MGNVFPGTIYHALLTRPAIIAFGRRKSRAAAESIS